MDKRTHKYTWHSHNALSQRKNKRSLLVYDIDEETGTRQFSFYAIWLFSACAVSMVTLPPYIYYLCRRSTIQATAVNNIKYTLLDVSDIFI